MRFICAAFAALVSYAAAAFTPQAGLWVIDSENNGAPGRGFQIDVQDATLVLTFYGYTTDGSPTFYLSAGPLSANQFSGDLSTFRDGTTFGALPRNASTQRNAGRVQLGFVSDSRGTITLPGEAPKTVSRLSFGVGTGVDRLYGEWTIVYHIGQFAQIPFVDRFTLTALRAATPDGTGTVWSADGKYVCEDFFRGTFAGKVVCFDLSSTTSTGAWILDLSINQASGSYFLRTPSNGVGSVYETALAWRTKGRSGLGTYAKSAQVWHGNDVGKRDAVSQIEANPAPPALASAIDGLRTQVMRLIP